MMLDFLFDSALQANRCGKAAVEIIEVQIGLLWWAFTDSNRGPTGYEPVALTD